MNKISKKIVSLVTMAAFAVTLVPAAAFAHEPNANETAAAASSYEITVDQNQAIGSADVTFDLNSAANTAIKESDKARIFVELTGGDASKAKVCLLYTSPSPRD